MSLLFELTVVSQEPSCGSVDLFSSEVEPRASHKTGKGSTTPSILSLVTRFK